MSTANAITTPIRAAVFSTPDAARRTVDALLAQGFTPQEITVVSSDEAKERYFRAYEHQHQAGASAPAAAAAGGAIGAALCGLSAVAASIATGGVPVIIAGAWAVMTGGVAGGFLGAMLTRGIEKEVANYYDQAVAQGKLLVAVEIHGSNSDRRLALAEQILAREGKKPLSLPEG